LIHRHHRRKGNREDNRPVNILLVDSEVHEWIELHPEEARDLGWSVSRYDDPEAISVTIPKTIIAEKIKKERKKREKPRKKVIWSVRAPKDSEDGVAILEEGLEECRELLAPVLGWEKDVGMYVVLVAVVTDWLNTNR
jgi:hypothetical protein